MSERGFSSPARLCTGRTPCFKGGTALSDCLILPLRGLPTTKDLPDGSFLGTHSACSHFQYAISRCAQVCRTLLSKGFVAVFLGPFGHNFGRQWFNSAPG